jgi:ABC-type sugar transport system permease subunit
VRLYGRDRVIALLMLGIPLAFELVWVLWPALQSIYISTLDWDGFSQPTFVGLENYASLPEDPLFTQSLWNTLKWLVAFGVLSVAGGLLLALAVHQRISGWRFYRSAFFAPIAVSFVVTGLVWRWMLAPTGVINQALEMVGLEGVTQNWLGDPNLALWSIIAAATWRQVGYIMILFLAGLTAVDKSVLEAASVDGASSLQKFWHVTLPALAPATTIIIAVTVIDSLRTFDIIWTMTQGGPFNSTDVLSTYMWREAFQYLHLGYGSAVAIVILSLSVGFIIVYLRRVLGKAASA